MKALEQVKEEYARRMGYKYWTDLLNDDNLELSEIYDHHDQVAIELALQNLGSAKVLNDRDKLTPLTEMSAGHFSKIFTGAFAPSYMKEIIGRFKSLHGFHDAIASFGDFSSYRTAIELGYDVEFTISNNGKN